MGRIMLHASAYPHNQEMLEALQEYFDPLPNVMDPESEAAFMLGLVVKDFFNNAKVSWAVEMPLVDLLVQHGWCQRTGAFKFHTIDMASLKQQLNKLIGFVQQL